MDKRHLLILTPGFPIDESDSRCIPALQLFIEELKKREIFQITIVTFHYPYHPKTYEWKGISVHALGGNNKKGLKRALLFSRALGLSKKINTENKVDLIHSFWLGECSWIGNKLAAKWKVKHSCTLMGQDVLKANGYVKKINPLPPLIALSKAHAEAFSEEWNIQVDHIIPWGVKPMENSSLQRNIDVLGVGNLTELKAFDRFIRLIGLIKLKQPSIKAVIVGEGNQQPLIDLVKEHQLQQHVTLLGIRTREEVLQLMKKSRALLHCSNFESFGMVIVEALSCGAAVFSTAVGIAPEIKELSIFENDQQLVEQVDAFLNSGKEEQFLIPFDIQATVNSYLNSVF